MLIAPPPPATATRPVAFYDTECFPNYWLLKFRPKGGQVYGFRLRAGQAFDLVTAWPFGAGRYFWKRDADF